MLFIAPASWHIPARDEGEMYPVISLQAIADLPFIMPPRQLKHNWIIRNMMDAAEVKLRVILHSCSNEMTFEMIRRGLGVSLAPNTFVFSWVDERLALYCVEGCSSQNNLYYNRPLNSKVSHDEQVFIALAKEWVAEHPMLRAHSLSEEEARFADECTSTPADK